MGVSQAPPWRHSTRDAEQAVPAHLGREVGTAVGPTGDGMTLGRLGPRHIDCRDPRLGTYTRPPRSTSGTS